MYHKSEHDRWWFSDEISAMPGVVVPIFGAGLSVDPPSRLPKGIELTEKLMDRLFHFSVKEELIKSFKEHPDVVGRQVPRLEHLLSVATQATAEAANLLKIFEDVPPNRNHRILAEYLITRRGWAITTNFDECVEKASNFTIPVHVFDPTKGRVRVLYGDNNADWGLIKLHGTVGVGVKELSATIEQLTPGLALPVQELLDRVFSSANFVVVAGYSGSDHFDVNRYFESKLGGGGFRAHILWVQYTSKTGPTAPANFPSSETYEPSPQTRGPDAFQRAFFGARSLQSHDIPDLLGNFLGCQVSEVVADPTPIPWSEKLTEMYTPSKVDKHRMGAIFGRNVGLSNVIDRSIMQLRWELENDQECLREEIKSLELQGYWKTARNVLRRYTKVSGENTRLLVGSNLRKSGRPSAALAFLILSPVFARITRCIYPRQKSQPQVNSEPDNNLEWQNRSVELMMCVVDIWRKIRRTRFGRTKLFNHVIAHIVYRLRDAFVERNHDQLSADAEIDLQLVGVRAMAYDSYDRGGRGGGDPHWLFALIEAEMAQPDFYVGDGPPLISGFYLNAAMTNAELDRVADLFEVRLAYADALIACIQNCYLDCHKWFRRWLVKRFLGEDSHSWYLRNELYYAAHPQASVALIQSQLEKARDATAFLDNPEVYARFARFWVFADGAVCKFRTWEQQGLFMPSLTKSEIERRRAETAAHSRPLLR